MEELLEIANRLKALNEKTIEQLILQWLKEFGDEMLNMERQRLLQGLNAKGEPLKPEYASDSYANYKLRFNPLGVVDLTLTGEFTKSFYIDFSSFPIKLYATDGKTEKLVAKYGEEIFGETEQDLETIRDYIAARYQDYIQQLLEL